MPVTATAITYAIIGWVIVGAAVAGTIALMGAQKISQPGFGSIGGGLDGSPRYGFGALQNTTTSELPVAVLYGTLKMYGNNIYQSEPGETVKRAICLCEGEVNSIGTVLVNDVPIADLTGCSYTAYTGTSTQDVDARFSGEVYGLRYSAYLALTLKASDELKGGNPTVSCVVEGTKIRTWDGSVWSGSTFSNNPAACLLDFLTNSRYGCGLADSVIDFDSFGSVYDYCNGQVDDNDGGEENRYELDMVIDSFRPQLDILGDILATFSSFLVWSQGKLYLRTERDSATVQLFDEDNIKLGSTSFAQVGKDQLINRVKVLFMDPSNEYTKVFAIAEDLNDQALREDLEGNRGIISTELSLLGIIRQSQALRMANFFLRAGRVAGTTFTFTTSIEAVHCEPGDIIEITFGDYNWTNKGFRISSIREMENDEREIACVEHKGTLYTDSYGGDLASSIMPVTPVTDYENQALPSVTSLSLAESNYYNHDGAYCSDIDASWTGITVGVEYFSHYIIELKKGGAGYLVVGTTTGTSFTIPDVESQATYYVKVKTVSTSGLISAGTTSSVITIAGNTGAPGTVAGFANIFTDEIKLSWTPNTDADLWGYEIRTNDGTWASGDTSNLVWRGQANNYTIVRPSSRAPGKHYIRAIDRSGNYSVASDDTTPSNAAPSAPVITASYWFGYAKLEWQDSVDADLKHYDVYVSRDNEWAGEEYLEARVVGTESVVQGEASAVGSGDSGGATYLQSTKLIGSGDNRFTGDTLTLNRGTGTGQSKTVIGYDSSIGRVTGDSAWSTNPDVTSEWLLHDNRYYKVYGVDSYGSGDASNVVGISYKTLEENQLGDEIIKARNLYAGEIITLSAQIKDAIINNAHIADLSVSKLTAGTLAAMSIVIATGGDIRSENYVSETTGFKLDGTDGLEVNSGSIKGSIIDRDFNLHVRGDLYLASYNTTSMVISSGIIYHGSTKVEKTTATTLTFATDADWIGGTNLATENGMVYAYVDASGNIKMHTTAPSKSDVDGNTAGKHRYAVISTAYYRCLAWVYVTVSADATVLLLHCNGVDESTTFTDVSASEHEITAVGNAQVDTAFKEFGTGSLLLDGAEGDRLTIPDSSDWDFGTGDFTFDCQIRLNTDKQDARLMELGTATSAGFMISLEDGANNIKVRLNNTTKEFAFSFSVDTWYHIAVTRASGTVRVFVAGVQKGGNEIMNGDISGVNVDGVVIGNNRDANLGYDGWIDEIRISNTARWTSNFTPPSAEYTTGSTVATADYATNFRDGDVATVISVVGTNDITTTNTSYEDMATMEVKFYATGGVVEMIFVAPIRIGAVTVYCTIDVDGTDKKFTSITSSITCPTTLFHMQELSVGVHTIKVQWKVTAGTGYQDGSTYGERILKIEEK